MIDPEKVKRNRLELALALTVVLWLVFHVWASVHNAVCSFDMGDGSAGYDAKAYLLTVCYLASILVMDILMYKLEAGSTARSLSRYWAVAGIMAFLVLWEHGQTADQNPAFLFVAPFVALASLVQLFDGYNGITLSGVVLFCWVNFFVCRCLCARGKE